METVKERPQPQAPWTVIREVARKKSGAEVVASTVFGAFATTRMLYIATRSTSPIFTDNRKVKPYHRVLQGFGTFAAGLNTACYGMELLDRIQTGRPLLDLHTQEKEKPVALAATAVMVTYSVAELIRGRTFVQNREYSRFGRFNGVSAVATTTARLALNLASKE